ncbi:B12-binding domain-containing radical SAM protein [Micromonospora sp. NPDC004336]
MVGSNFGTFYPATAVLAGYLAQHGITDTWQEDLNEEMASYLVETVGTPAGPVTGVEPGTFLEAAVRWVSGHRDRFVDPAGRHLFSPDNHLGQLLETLAQPLSIDPGADWLLRGSLELPAADVFRRFYAWHGTVERLPSSTRLLGLTVAMGPQLVPALVLAGLLAEARPDIRVVLGGPTISLMHPDELELLLREHPYVACAVRFDGEVPLLALARQVRAGAWDPGAVPGVSFLDGGDAVHVPPGPGPNLNKLPTPAFPALVERLAEPRLSITQARGCYWGKCDYCDFVELYDGSPPYRGRHADAFVQEMVELEQRFGVRRFNIVTESIPPAFARRISELMIERNLGYTWNSFAMVDRRFDRELLGRMVQAGCEYLVIGLETTVTRVLRLVHKSADRDENFRFLRDARDAGMRLKVNLIPDLPSTTYAEAMQALDDMRELADCLYSVSVFPFEATRSSRVGRDPARFGLLTDGAGDATGQSQFAMNHLPNVDPAMTPDERRRVHDLYRRFADEVGAARAPGGGDLDLATSVVRVPVGDLDVVADGGRMICTDMRTRLRTTVPAAAADLLAPYWTGSPFSTAEMAERLGPAVSAKLLSEIRRSGLLEVVSADV